MGNVVDCDPTTHIFKVKHPVSGQLKVVHGNLLLCVNFLPLEKKKTDDESVFSVDDGASDNCSVSSDDSMPDGQGPVVAEGDPQMIELCDAHDSNGVVNVPLQSVVSGNDSPDRQVFLGSPEKRDVCNSGPDVEGTIDGTELPGQRSKFGRLLKPVNRLISSMNQHTLFQNRKQTLNKWSISILSLK